MLHESINKEHLALKLNHLEEKSARYESHKDFFFFKLEPTIGNFDQEFIDKSFSKLKYYSFNLMKVIIKICDMVNAKIKLAIQNIEAKVKASMEREEFSKKTKKKRSVYFSKENSRNSTT